MNTPLRAFMVCVDYSDLLRITLPRNLPHFQEVNVITSERDPLTIEYCSSLKLDHFPVNLYVTESFYQDGADFNKWKALEKGLDFFGRDGWICLMDADVIWPTEVPPMRLEIGKLYTPVRRMFLDVRQPVPEECDWQKYPLHQNLAEWAGYSQIFHSSDPALGPAPWHEVSWRHAGGADSYFQMKWKPANKLRPDFEVLHLGPAGENWCGRATVRADGSVPDYATDKSRKVWEYIRSRKKYMNGKGIRSCISEKIDIHRDEKIS
jgi:hypothetical protein